jgi:iron-sulfur cluster insertion protein
MNIIITPAMVKKVERERVARNQPSLNLRITIEGGGCSGFQYIYSWDSDIKSEDTLFANAVVTDSMSLPFLHGSTIDYIVGLMGEDFKITNPNAASGCGCGTSFAV